MLAKCEKFSYAGPDNLLFGVIRMQTADSGLGQLLGQSAHLQSNHQSTNTAQLTVNCCLDLGCFGSGIPHLDRILACSVLNGCGFSGSAHRRGANPETREDERDFVEVV